MTSRGSQVPATSTTAATEGAGIRAGGDRRRRGRGLAAGWGCAPRAARRRRGRRRASSPPRRPGGRARPCQRQTRRVAHHLAVVAAARRGGGTSPGPAATPSAVRHSTTSRPPTERTSERAPRSRLAPTTYQPPGSAARATSSARRIRAGLASRHVGVQLARGRGIGRSSSGTRGRSAASLRAGDGGSGVGAAAQRGRGDGGLAPGGHPGAAGEDVVVGGLDAVEDAGVEHPGGAHAAPGGAGQVGQALVGLAVELAVAGDLEAHQVAPRPGVTRRAVGSAPKRSRSSWGT